MAKAVKPSFRWEVKQHAVVLRASLKGGETAEVLLTADRHWDHPCSDREMQERHLNEAAARGAAVCDFGDFFDAMQLGIDRRKSKADLLDELRPNDNEGYLDRLVNEAAKWAGKWGPNWALCGKGNHESFISRIAETDLNSRFVGRLNNMYGGGAIAGGYVGWLRFQFDINTTKRQSLDLYYTHGHGVGGPVTKGVIDAHRRQAAIDADIIVSGHLHDRWSVEGARLSLTQGCVETQKCVMHVQTASYKDAITSRRAGWDVEKGFPAKPLGAVWLRFTARADNIVVTTEQAR